MSNEELALLAKDGETDALMQLWHQSKRFGFWIGKQYDLDADDKAQAAFEALMHAVQTFEPGKYDFLSAYKYALHGTFLAAKYGGRSDKCRHDPISAALSLDAPASEDADTPLGDLIAVEADFSNVERQELAQAVREAVAQLPEPEQQIIACTFFRGMSTIESADVLGIDAATAQKLKENALKRLRHPSISRHLREYL